MKILIFAAILLLLIISNFAYSDQQSVDAKMLRYPDISSSDIAFVYAEDIWIVNKSGGIARRLTSAKGEELFPKFSPDGSKIAFSGNYDGNMDIYTIPSLGGEVKRLTFHPDDDYMVEWYPDSKNILYKSEMLSFVRRFNRFFKIGLNGGLPQALPLPYGEHASFGNDENTLFFQFITREDRYWRGYNGGMTTDIWKYQFDKDMADRVTSSKDSDSMPMWNGKYLYYMSDRGINRRNNIWKLDPETGKSIQVTFFKEYDVKWPSYGNGWVVFENGGSLYTIDTDTDKLSEAKVIVPDDLPEIRPEIKQFSKYITNFKLSPNGQKVLFEARGEIFTYDVENNFVKNLTNSSGVAERYPSWSHDSSKIAYFSDERGDYVLVLNDLEKDSKDIITLDKGFYYNIRWSPDGKYVAFSNNTGTLYYADIGKHKVVAIDKDDWSLLNHYSWSPDSRWLTYSKKLDSYESSIFMYDLKNQESHQVTNEFYNDTMPEFSDKGDYIAFYSDRNFNPLYSDFDETWIYPNSTELFILPLRKDQKSPFLPSDKSEKNEPDKKEADRLYDFNTNLVRIDFENMDERLIKIPVSAGNYGDIRFIGDRIYYIRGGKSGEDGASNRGNLKYYDLITKKEANIISNVDGFDVSVKGDKYIYRSGKKYGVLSTAKEGKVGEGSLQLDKIKGLVNYREEWQQIFNEAWRIERDFFYDPNMHGVDWNEIKNRYQRLLKYVVSRRDLNFIIGEMIGELNSSHEYIRGGDFNEPRKVGVGLLGCDFGYDKKNDAFYFKKIYGDVNSISFVQSPLRIPGLNIKEGDYLLKVNGLKLDTSLDPLSAFQGLDNQLVELTIGETPDIKHSRDVLVKTINREADLQLRYNNWVENNRLTVDKLSNGRIGYVYVPDTSVWGQNELVRQYMSLKNKPAVIIDERFNSGGQIPDRFIDLLNRPVLNYWARRDQHYLTTPFASNNGPKVMLINGWSGSGGDAFPYYFKKTGIGEIVGKRTLGALIGIGGYPKLIDGGYVTAPAYAFFNTEGKWGIEGYGVDPDYEVDNISHEHPGSTDPQLEKAINILMNKLSSISSPGIKIPQYPDKAIGDR